MSYGFGALAGQLLGTGNDFILISYLANPSAKSISFWVKPPPFSARDSFSDNPVLSKNTGPASEYFGLICKSPRYFIVVGSPSGTAGQDLNTWAEIPPSAGNPADGIFVCITWDATRSWASAVQPRLWVNGYECSQLNTRRVPAANTIAPTTDANSPWQIGRAKFDGFTEHGQLVVGEVALWDRLLKASEAVQISEGNAANLFPNGLKFYYSLLSNAEDVISKSSGVVTGAIVRQHPTVIPAPPIITPGLSVASTPPELNQYPIELVAGTLFSATITLKDGGVPVNLTGLTIRSQIKDVLGVVQGEFAVAVANQTTNPGVIQLSAKPANLMSLGFYNRAMRGRLWYDILLTSNAGSKVAYYPSEVRVIQGVTNV